MLPVRLHCHHRRTFAFGRRDRTLIRSIRIRAAPLSDSATRMASGPRAREVAARVDRTDRPNAPDRLEIECNKLNCFLTGAL